MTDPAGFAAAGIDLPQLVLATGALGTAAMAIVEMLKWTRLGTAGYGRIAKMLGQPYVRALEVAYGPDCSSFLQEIYRMGRGSGEFRRTLRQGLRIGFTPDTAAAMAETVGVVASADLQGVARALAAGQASGDDMQEVGADAAYASEASDDTAGELTDRQRGILGRFELAVDARIDAALALAEADYVAAAQATAAAVSIVLAVATSMNMDVAWWRGLLVGVAAVPLAPIAKDVTKGLRAASQALGGGSRKAA